MKWFDKILLGVLSVVVIVLALAALSAAVRFPLDTLGQQQLLESLSEPIPAIVTCAVSVLLIAAAVRLIVSLFQKRDRAPTSVLVRQTESGNSFMTVSALNGMVSRYVQASDMVRECKTTVAPVGDAVRILIRVGAKPDAVIPVLGEELQRNVKTYIETYSGVRVETVEIVIETTEASTAPARVS